MHVHVRVCVFVRACEHVWYYSHLHVHLHLPTWAAHWEPSMLAIESMWGSKSSSAVSATCGSWRQQMQL